MRPIGLNYMYTCNQQICS